MAFLHCVLSDVLQDYYFEQKLLSHLSNLNYFSSMCVLWWLTGLQFRKKTPFIIIFTFKWLIFFHHSMIYAIYKLVTLFVNKNLKYNTYNLCNSGNCIPMQLIWLYWYDLSPVWIIWCLSRHPFSEDALSQWLHWWGSSLPCVTADGYMIRILSICIVV